MHGRLLMGMRWHTPTWCPVE